MLAVMILSLSLALETKLQVGVLLPWITGLKNLQ